MGCCRHCHDAVAVNVAYGVFLTVQYVVFCSEKQLSQEGFILPFKVALFVMMAYPDEIASKSTPEYALSALPK